MESSVYTDWLTGRTLNSIYYYTHNHAHKYNRRYSQNQMFFFSSLFFYTKHQKYHMLYMLAGIAWILLDSLHVRNEPIRVFWALSV